MSNRATPTRIMFCNYNSYPGGGAQTVTSHLAEHLSQCGYEVFVMTSKLRDELITQQDRRCIKGFFVCPYKISQRQVAAEWIAERCNDLGIDIFVFQDITPAMIDYLQSITPHTKFIYCCHSVPLWRFLRRVALNDSKNRGLFSRLFQPILRPLQMANWRRRYLAAETKMMRHCDASMALCEAYRSSLARLTGVSEGTFAIENGTTHRDRLVDVERQKQLLYVGRLTMTAKRVDRLLRVWSLLQGEFADWSLEIVGDGDMAERFRHLSKGLGLERVTWHGWTTDPAPFYARAAVTCLTSEFEGWPMTFGEAMQQGSIAAAFNVSAGVAELVGDAGVLVEPAVCEADSEQAYAEALRGVMRDEKLRAELSDRAVAQAARFTVEHMGQKYIEMFDYVLKR